MGRIIIGFGNKRRRGKDTCTDLAIEYLSQKYNILARKDMFAATLKEVVKVAFGFTDFDLEGCKEVEDSFWKITPRQALQIVGTECFRKQVDQDFWVKTLVCRVNNSQYESRIISDVRFHNEAVAVKDLGGYLIQVNRVVSPNKSRDFHDSETGLDGYDWDYTIDNNGTIEELTIKVHKIINNIMEKRK